MDDDENQYSSSEENTAAPVAATTTASGSSADLRTSNSNKVNDTVVLLEFFRQAAQSLTALMPIHLDVTSSTPTTSVAWKSLSEIRAIVVSKQTECLQSSIDACFNNNSNICRSRNGECSNTGDFNNTTTDIVVDVDDDDDDVYTVTHLQRALQSIAGITKKPLHSSSSSSSSSSSCALSIEQPQQQQREEVEVHSAMERLNETARIAFCSSVLDQEFRYDRQNHRCTTISGSPVELPPQQPSPQLLQPSSTTTPTTTTTLTIDTVVPPNRTLISSSSTSMYGTVAPMLTGTEILEYCGLCCTAMRIPAVRHYIQQQPWHISTAAVPTTTTTPTTEENQPDDEEQQIQQQRQRLQHIQRLLARAMGYDPEYGTRLLQEMFDNVNTNNIDVNAEQNNNCIDPHVTSTFRHMEQVMEQTLSDIATKNKNRNETLINNTTIVNNNNNGTNTNVYNKSDTDTADDDNNVTRIVAVTYSEKYIDARTGQEIMTVHPDDVDDDENGTGAPRSLTMDNTDIPSRRNTDDENEILQQKASRLEQEILDELLCMGDEERVIKVNEINTIVQTVMNHIMTHLVQPHDRISYLTNLDPYTQRCMAMKKIWDTYTSTTTTSHDP